MPALVILVLACNVDPDGKPNAQTRGRCQKAAERYFSLKKEGRVMPFLAVSNATVLKVEQGEVMMGKSMVDYLVSLGVPSEDIIFTPQSPAQVPGGLNTAGEIDSLIDWIKKNKIKDKVLLGFASTFYHIPRLTYLFLMRGWWPAAVCVSSGPVVFVGDVLLEIPKFLLSFFRPYRSLRQQA